MIHNRGRNAMLRTVGIVSIGTLLLSGCAMGVRPWNRDVLARKSMQLNPHPRVTAFREHVYFSKEAATGGRTYDAGGCGCN